MVGVFTPFALLLLAFCVTAETLCDVGYKHSTDVAAKSVGFALALASSPLFWATLALSACEIVAWVLVLQHTPLAAAYPVMTLTYAAVPIAGLLILHERMTRKQMIGALLVAVGVATTTLSGA